MKFVIRDLPEDLPKDLAADLDPQAMDAEFVDLKYDGLVHLKGTALRSETTIHFWGNLTAKIEEMCGRCLETVREGVERPFDLYYEIEGKQEIDTLDDLREILILEHPASFLCRGDCRGLCPGCGCNLNNEKCTCAQRKNEPEALSKFGQILRRAKEDSSNG